MSATDGPAVSEMFCGGATPWAGPPVAMRSEQVSDPAHTSAERVDESDGLPGATPLGRAAAGDAREASSGPAQDDMTVALGSAAKDWRDVQQTRLALAQRGSETLAEALKPVEESAARKVTALLRRHPLWPWLAQYPGMGGVHTARLVAIIRDPRRFPGQPCTLGHIAPAIYPPGTPCLAADLETGEECPGTLTPPRPGTGTRSLWHYLGLHVVDGHSPRKRRGQRVDWHLEGRTACLMPGGLAEQIVRQRVPRYRDIYDATKVRLTQERGAEAAGVTDMTGWPRLRPFQVDAIARKVAVKAFVGDLLAEWKRLAVTSSEVDTPCGEAMATTSTPATGGTRATR